MSTVAKLSTGPQAVQLPAAMAGRLPPHDLDAEASVLSAILLKRETLDQVIDLLKPADFYSDSNGWIYEAAQQLAIDGQPCDITTIAGWLRTRDRFHQVGGASYLAQLSDATPAVGNVVAHARVVRNKSIQREMLGRLWRQLSEGYGNVGDVREWVDRIEAEVHGVTNVTGADANAESMRVVLTRVFAGLQADNPDPGVVTGLVDLDRVLGPMLPGQMIVIGAHSGVGKSALAMQIVMNASRRQVTLPGAVPVWQASLVFSAEMTSDELGLRVLFGEARVDSSKASRRNDLSTDEWGALARAAPAVAIDTVYFDDRPSLSPLKIRAKARRVKAQAERDGFRLRLIMVDYIQLLDGTFDGTQKHERREREIAACSVALKGLAKELGIPIIVLAQLNDEANKEKRLPRKEDLRECKAVVQDADKVLLIWNPSAATRSHQRREKGAAFSAEVADLIVDKNRGGQNGRALAWFLPTYTTFTDMSREDVERVEEERGRAAESGRRGGGRRGQ